MLNRATSWGGPTLVRLRFILRRSSLFAAILAAFVTTAAAQTVDQMRVGLPWQTVSLNGAAFTAIDADGANLLLTATSDVVPVIAEYASLAPDRGLSVFICGEEFPNFQPTPRAAFGELVIPLSTRQPQPAPHLSWPGKSVAMTLRRRSHPRPPLQVFFRRHPWRMTRPLTCPTMTYW